MIFGFFGIDLLNKPFYAVIFGEKALKTNKNRILTLALTLIVTLPVIGVSIPAVCAEEETEATLEGQPLRLKREGVWYKFETPLVTLLFPAQGKKPMFLWWYTNDSSEVYVVKFKGLVEYLTFDFPYYDRRYAADVLTIRERLRERYIEPAISQFQSGQREQIREMIMQKLIGWLIGLHSPILPFSGCSWQLEGPKLVSEDNTSYWSFNFTLNSVPMPAYYFAEDNIHIRCRFYNVTTTETIDKDHNYTVAAGQLKFDFIVDNWEWNIDKLKDFLDWIKSNHPEYDITIPPHRTGLALWINMASIELEDVDDVEGEFEYDYRNTVEARSQMQGAMIDKNYYPVTQNATQNPDEHEKTIRLTSQLRRRIRLQFARKKGTISGFLEFVPWARLLNETGATVDYINVTASYIAAGSHLRLFLCYPYFGSHTLEHDPTIGLASAPPIPTFIKPGLIIILIGATMAIAVAVAAVKMRKKPVNILSVP